MSKIFEAIVEGFYWLTIWLSPALLFSVAAFVVYTKNQSLAWLAITMLVIGALLGVFLAERIRRRHGCTHYVAKILGTPDIWPDEPEKKS